MKKLLLAVIMAGGLVFIAKGAYAVEYKNVVLETNQGQIEIRLFPDIAPKACENFTKLVEKGYYNGLIFHRVIRSFMIQGGDPTGTGSGGPGYQFADEFTHRKHVMGALSMANAGPKTNGSQFFICYKPQPHLNGKHSVFGQLTQGMDALKKLKNGAKIISVTIKESPQA